MTCLDRVLRLHALRLAVAAFVIAPSAPVLAADCAQWNVAGKHVVVQANDTVSEMTLQQDGIMFKGSIYYSDLRNHEWYKISGDIVGTVAGSKFEATVYWSDNKVGVYTGQIGPQGLLVGRTFDKKNPATNADFHGSPAFDCLTKAAPNAAANNGNSGKPAIALGRTNAPAPPPLKVSQLPGAAGQPPAALNPQLLAPKTSAGAVASASKPIIVEPRVGGIYPQQTPLRVRVAPVNDAKDTAYRIEIQVRRNILIWDDVATVAAPAGMAQSPQGYLGWGGKPGGPVTQMTAMPGVYRMRVRGTTPQLGEPGDWVQFKIDGMPAMQADAMNQPKPAPGKAGDAAQPATSGLAGQPSMPNALGTAPALAVQNKAGAASLNPQPLPPKTSPGAVTLNPQSLAPKSLSGAASLNPQPLPPGGLQQAPSSMR
jgi:hypothetical protein